MYKTLHKDRATRTLLKTEGELSCSGRVSKSCSICGTRLVDPEPVISHTRGKDRLVLTTRGTYPCSFVTQIFVMYIAFHFYPIEVQLSHRCHVWRFILGTHQSIRSYCLILNCQNNKPTISIFFYPSSRNIAELSKVLTFYFSFFLWRTEKDDCWIYCVPPRYLDNLS